MGHGGGEIDLTRQRAALGLDYAPTTEVCRGDQVHHAQGGWEENGEDGVMYKLGLAVLLILIVVVGFGGIWYYERQPQITLYIRSEEGWNTNLFKGKSISLNVGEDPVCKFKLARLIDLMSEDFQLNTVYQKTSWPQIIFDTNCKMTSSTFYKYKVAISILVGFCFEPNIICPSKVFEIDRPIDEKDWDRVVPVIVKEMHRNGASDRRLRIP